MNEDENKYIWKSAVYNTTEAADQEFNVVFPDVEDGAEAKLTILTAPDAFSQNYFGEEDVVNTECVTVRAGQDGFGFTLPQWSVALLEWSVGGGGDLYVPRIMVPGEDLDDRI